MRPTLPLTLASRLGPEGGLHEALAALLWCPQGALRVAVRWAAEAAAASSFLSAFAFRKVPPQPGWPQGLGVPKGTGNSQREQRVMRVAGGVVLSFPFSCLRCAAACETAGQFQKRSSVQ